MFCFLLHIVIFNPVKYFMHLNTIFQTLSFMVTILALYILRYYILIFALFTHSVLFSLNSLD